MTPVDDDHLVAYARACLKESEEASSEQRSLWMKLDDMYENKGDFSNKEEWQNQISLDKPFSTIQQAKTIIRNGLVDTKKFWSVGPAVSPATKESEVKAEIADTLFEYYLSKGRLDFASYFSDASEVAFTLGTSSYLKLIVTLKPTFKAKIELINPRNVFRDPDADPRDSQSGLYLIHQEYMDWWEIVQKYPRELIEQVKSHIAEAEHDPRAGSRVNSMHRSKYRKSYQVLEFYGNVLDDDGEVVAENVTYTVIGNTVVSPMRQVPYKSSRFPMVAFNPLPHPEKVDGRGILNGVQNVWKLLNALLSINADTLNNNLNRSYELNVNDMVDPTDTKDRPNKFWLKKTDRRLLTPVNEISNNQEILSNFQLFEKLWQEYSFISEFTAGIPQMDFRRRTAKETEIKSNQSLGVFGMMSGNIENGIVAFLNLLYDVIMTHYDSESFPKEIFNDPDVAMLMEIAGLENDPEAKNQMIRGDNIFTITAISGMLHNKEVLEKIFSLLQLAGNPAFAGFFRYDQVVKEIVRLLDLDDKNLLLTPEEMQQMALQAQMMVATQEAAAGKGSAQPANAAMGAAAPQ